MSDNGDRIINDRDINDRDIDDEPNNNTNNSPEQQQQQESDPIAEGKSVLIKNLKFETSPSRVRKIFEKFGPVRDVYVPLDYFTKRPRGFAFVEFFSADDASIAVSNVHHTLVDGSEVTVLLAQDRRKTPDIMRTICTERGRSRGYDGRDGRDNRDRYGGRDRYDGGRDDRRGYGGYRDSRRDGGHHSSSDYNRGSDSRRGYDDYDRRDHSRRGDRSRRSASPRRRSPDNEISSSTIRDRHQPYNTTNEEQPSSRNYSTSSRRRSRTPERGGAYESRRSDYS